MLHLAIILLALAAISLAFATSPGINVPSVAVRLRVVDGSQTIFDQLILTNGHNVTTASGGTHHCDGTNNNTYPTPVPVATAALDDASKIGNFTWDGDWYPEYDDYFITQIADIPSEAAAMRYSSKYWSIEVNSKPIDVGGCQERVYEGDDVLFTYIDSAPTTDSGRSNIHVVAADEGKFWS
ncbi:hypothetical protein H0H92_005678 [Tricholoma furcatifolium]|nr:hypothetical protein H0H92_005678 [Tricholoma furcatifolium]